MRRSALPSVWPKPRSSGSATTVANRLESEPGVTCSLLGRMSSCQFFWIVTVSPLRVNGAGQAICLQIAGAGIREQSAAVKFQKMIARRCEPPANTCQTRRRLRGRQPLCGIVVTSRIDVTVKPAACSARSADSRPEPGPATSTSSVRMPCSCAFLETSSAATCAAYGAGLRDPLKPMVPADDQAIVLPCASVMVIVVLLNDEFTCATPEAMFLRSRRRTRAAASLPIANLSYDLDTAVMPAAPPKIANGHKRMAI